MNQKPNSSSDSEEQTSPEIQQDPAATETDQATSAEQDNSSLKNIIEAVLMVADQPLSIDRLFKLFEDDGGEPPQREQIKAVLSELEQDYAERGIELKQVASGYRLQAKADVAKWVNRLWTERPPKYTRALLETLAIIAYRQPITRGEIEAVRGVSVSSNVIKTLLEREWVKQAGHRDVPGRPAVYATTKHFLDYFNLKSLSDLPSLSELRDLDAIAGDLFNQPFQLINGDKDNMASDADSGSDPSASTSQGDQASEQTPSTDDHPTEEKPKIDEAE